MLASGAYVATRAHTVASTAVVQLTTQGTSPITVTLPTSATSDQSITNAAAILHVTTAQATSDAAGVTSSLNGTGNQISITDSGTDPAATQSIADAFATSYVSLLAQQYQTALTRLDTNQQTLKNEITSLETTLSKGANQLVTTQLNAATQAYGSLEAQIIALKTSPAPATLYSQALPGVPTGSGKGKILGVAFVIGLITGAGISTLR